MSVLISRDIKVLIYVFSDNIKLHSILKLGTKTKSDGQKYIDIKSSNIEHSYDGRVSYSMTNLFKGNPEISKYNLLGFLFSIFLLCCTYTRIFPES